MTTTPIDREVSARPEEHLGAPQPCGVYVCPACKQELRQGHQELRCSACAVTYPIRNGIPDFIVQKLEQSTNHTLRKLGKIDSSFILNRVTGVYETLIYPLVCNIYGGWRSTSLQELARNVADIIGPTEGVILDLACGPGTYGRRIACPSRTVYGVDACMSFLRHGARYVERSHIPNVHFARCTVEALPFRAGLFDAAICAGSLNHFSDTLLVLREVSRTMKPGAPLAVMCFFVGDRGLIRSKSIRDRAEKGHAHIFELPELSEYVTNAGFDGFHYQAHGSIIVFSARKKPDEP